MVEFFPNTRISERKYKEDVCLNTHMMAITCTSSCDKWQINGTAAAGCFVKMREMSNLSADSGK